MGTDLITLNPAAKVAEGGERSVYVHPDDPTRLIKVLKPVPPEKMVKWKFSHLTRRYIPSSRWRTTTKQYDEYRRLMLDHQFDADFNLPVSHLYGFVKTSLGLGCVSERVMAQNENAPTLESLVSQGGLSDDLLKTLNRFVARLYDISVCVADVGPANFVYGQRFIGGAGVASEDEWVLIDGFGDRFAVPLRTWSRRARQFGIDDAFKRRKKVAGLNWDPAARQFKR